MIASQRAERQCFESALKYHIESVADARDWLADPIRLESKRIDGDFLEALHASRLAIRAINYYMERELGGAPAWSKYERESKGRNARNGGYHGTDG